MNGIQRCHPCTADNLLFEMKKGIDPGIEGIQCWFPNEEKKRDGEMEKLRRKRTTKKRLRNEYVYMALSVAILLVSLHF